jgi:hypothetical protein
MRKKLIGMLLVWIVVSQGLFSMQETGESESADVDVNLDFRTLQPGEVVRITLQSDRTIKQADVQFLGEKYAMGHGQIADEWLAFLGLDLGLEPGPYPLGISLLFTDGHYQNIHREILVREKEFPLKKLWVKQEYVTPPKEVLDRIQWESELLGMVLDIYTPEWLGEGGFIIPSEGTVNPNFGERRIFNNEPRSPHGGVDISSPLGDPVRAANSGRVVLAKDLYFAGKTVIIDHGLGVFTQYLHFSKIIARRGDFVKKGGVIGEIGATGRVTGPHLHWGLRIFGSRVDPFSLLDLKF